MEVEAVTGMTCLPLVDAEAPFFLDTVLKMQVTMRGFLERSLAHTNCAFPFCVAK